jgi:hypothetical protein
MLQWELKVDDDDDDDEDGTIYLRTLSVVQNI